MRKSLLTLSLALLLGGASTVIATAQSEAPAARNPLLLAQATPDVRPLPPREGRGPGARRTPPSAEQIAERRQARCEDRADRLAGQLAYLEARLDLTASQRPAFNRWRDVRLAAANARARACTERPLPGRGPNAARPNPVEQMARQEEMLSQRLADLSVQRPALEALYNSLSAEQREKFRPAGGRGMGRGGMRPRMAMIMRDRLIQRGMRGPEGRGRGPGMGPPPGGPGAPPPAQ